MTRWAIVADLSRCVGCQTCTASCKHRNATGPWVQWRKVLDFEVGTFPDVSRAFVPVGCMHCENPSCMEVCPTTATRQRDDGIVTIDFDVCIGCTYCIQSCPYQARYKVDTENEVYGHGKQMGHELKREDWSRRGVAQKCTFCEDRIDDGLTHGLKPGIDEAATPACVASCISGALQMGDLDDPESNVSRLLRDKRHFRMHEELGNDPGFYYLYDGDGSDNSPAGSPEMVPDSVGMNAISPQLQSHWDWRAAGNFSFGGTGTGLMTAVMLAGLFTPALWFATLIAMSFVGAGLFLVWLEIGRPMRFLNVYLNPTTSWMSREAYAVMPFFILGVMAWLMESLVLGTASAIAGLGFLYAQGRVLRAAKAIPVWRGQGIVGLIVATGLCEGAGLFVVVSEIGGLALAPQMALALGFLITLRQGAWIRYRAAFNRTGAPTKSISALDTWPVFSHWLQGVLLIFLVYGTMGLPGYNIVLILAGLGALTTGWVFKFNLITRAAYNQGYAINKMPARGSGASRAGVQPGWVKA